MEPLWNGLIVLVLLFLLVRTSKLRRRLDAAEDQLRTLQKEWTKARRLAESDSPSPVEPVPAAPVEIVPVEAPPVPEVQPEAPPPEVTAAAAPRPTPRPARSDTWQRRERFVLENLTGILGTVGVVLGLGFLAVYTALMLAPVFRALVLGLVSTGLAVGAGFFVKNPRWRALAQWVQSAAFAVFLLTCLGSGGVPGLQWITQPLVALAVLALGVAANLGLAWARRSPVFASVHGVLALLALGVPGPSEPIVVTMALVALGSLLLIRGQRWEVHLGIIEAVFVAVLVLFFAALEGRPSETLRVLVTAGLVIVFVVGQATHYRRVHANTPGTLAAVVHLSYWVLTALGLVLWAPQQVLLLSPCLAALGVVTGVIARLARHRRIGWLYRIDTLIAFASLLGAALALMNWQVALTPVLMVALVVALGFTLWMGLEREPFLARVGMRTTEVLVLVVSGVSVVGTDAVALGVTGLVVGVFQALFVHRWKALQFPPSVLDLVLPWVFVVATLLISYETGLRGYALLGPLLGLFLWYRGRTSRLLHWGLLTATSAYSLLEGAQLVLRAVQSLDGPTALVASLPLVLLPLGGLLLFPKAEVGARRLLLWVTGVNFALGSGLVLAIVAPVTLPAFWVWCGTALVVPTRSSLRAPRTALGYGLVALGLAGGMAMAARAFGTALPDRWIAEALTLAGPLALFVTRRLRPRTGTPALDELGSACLDVAVLGVMMVLWFEVPHGLVPSALAGWALVLLGLGLARRMPPRLLIHALVAFWASLVLVVPAAVGHGTTLAVTAGVQVLWLGLVFRGRRVLMQSTRFGWAQPLAPLLGASLAPSTVLPLAATWALGIVFVTDAGLWTLVWSLEAFAVFVLALVLRQPSFRIVSLVALGGCLVRLVFYDLAQADTLSRALVFLGMGVLLILMNVLYTRFKSRVESDRG